MKHMYRSIQTDELLIPFVTNILHIKNEEEKRFAINLILEAEMNLDRLNTYQTLNHIAYRDFEYQDDEKRNKLRLEILSDLINFERTPKDDDMRLHIGGAKPIGNPPVAEKKIYFIIGLPASGKSGISNVIADTTKSYILDSDMAKRKLPEYYNKRGGASLVHEESDNIIFYHKDEYGNNLNLFNYCVESGYNIVVPKIGHNIDGIIKFISPLKEKGYTPYLVLVDLDRTKATIRAYNRFKKELRYVPLSVIFDGYSNDPILNYYRIKQKFYDYFEGYLQVSTDVPIDQPPQIIEKLNIDEFDFTK